MGPMDAKMRLAREIVTQYHGADAALGAEARFVQIHRNRDIPEDIPEHRLPAGGESMWICKLMTEAALTKSTSEARRVIRQRGVRIDGQVVVDEKLQVPAEASLLLQKGKRHFVRIIFE